MKQLTIKTATIDTLIICAVVLTAAILADSAPLRWILVACIVMAIVEIFVNCDDCEISRGEIETVYTTFMLVELMAAICIVLHYHLDWKQYILCLGLVMASDAGGLFFGRIFGKRQPFFSRNLSPNKTWAGYLGELLTTWSLGWLGLFVLGMPLSWPNVVFVCTGFIVCAVGDLIGSGAKRELGIKHSGERLLDIPVLGKIELLMRSRHGFLDCMDSASFALTFYIFLSTIGRL